MNSALIISAIIQAVASGVIAIYAIKSWQTTKRIKEENEKLTKHNFDENKKLIQALVASNLCQPQFRVTHGYSQDQIFKVFNDTLNRFKKG